MTTNDQIAACAELDGKTHLFWVNNEMLYSLHQSPAEEVNYDSLDLLIPAIRRWCNQHHGWSSYCHYLRLSAIVEWQTCAEILSKEPAQLREAWLRTAGKWKE